jgi:hypothetical protein
MAADGQGFTSGVEASSMSRGDLYNTARDAQ